MSRMTMTLLFVWQLWQRVVGRSVRPCQPLACPPPPVLMAWRKCGNPVGLAVLHRIVCIWAACWLATLGSSRCLLAQQDPGLADIVTLVSADLETLDHRYRVPLDEDAWKVRRNLLRSWQTKLRRLDFEGLSRAAQIDYLLLQSELDYRLHQLRLESQRDQEAAALIPYHQGLVTLLKAREEVQSVEPQQMADVLDAAAAEAERVTASLRDKSPESVKPRQKLAGLRAADLLASLERAINEMHQFYNGYDPMYSWWCSKPVERLRDALRQHRLMLREKLVGVPESDKETIIGIPIGEEGLKVELQHEWIVHTPAELIELAEREMQWCDAQMRAAAAELGFGDDWKAALDHVKQDHVAPGKQPELIRDLAWEAIRFLQAHDLVTIPPLAANGWRMQMMSPERQRVNPYFLGGDSIIVSYPTDTMTHEEKLMGMRSNNVHFSRATVHHELIPGHHLQYYALRRYRPYRRLFGTPFWMEGWALYWEMLLWDLDFARSAEDRIGMLFWRKHRCARIIFSLSYHLGKMTPAECIEFLIDNVGHERSAATAEVRRSIMGGYSPLYQAAYMLGGLQLRKLHTELVESGQMTNRQFHDAVLREHSIPIEPLRLYLTKAPLRRDTKPSWRFADP